MTNILEKIVIDKRIEVEQLKLEKPLASFIDELKPSTKDMYEALRRTKEKPEAGFILECKKASPSKGLIRSDFYVKAICQIYDKYAAAISVLTDEKYFQGTFDYLKIVTGTVKCPVLNKDFFVDTYQVYLARYYGADAILLMLSVLSDDEYRELDAVAKQYNLAVLTEISTEEERDRAIALGAKMIGINNRNLRDLSTDITRTFEFAPTLPEDRILISESGIYTNAQVRELAPAVNGFLVGSSIMAEADIDLACRKLIFGNNKVCGLTTPEHALAAAKAGAQFGGLIFAEKSTRCVTQHQAEDIVSKAPKLHYVGVFVDQPLQQVIELVKSLNLFAVQLHGNEDQNYIDQLNHLLTKEITKKIPQEVTQEVTQEFASTKAAKCQIWKAIPVSNEIPDFNVTAHHYVLDGKNPGSGQTFNWRGLADSEQDLSKCFLAGGLNGENIKDAVNQLTAHDLFGLDLNSGVETSPGVKCSDKLDDVFAVIRNY
ncbi:MAG: bifunctional indole-3-glycerol-phosphate synthase TrpC/phosphoribosylanthranilate isomerase TrpF [Alteromonadaceae bacterium]|nr:bifunctional indole-3-glycerol-phosphate synthase TrpC/phosphoribosylanthranilate isomerase TrpF [Alteromonadaceae bacterium]